MGETVFGPNDRFRVDPDCLKHYKGKTTRVETAAFDDPNLSLGGFGVLCWIRCQQQHHGKADDWAPTFADLNHPFSDSPEELLQLLDELRALGYIPAEGGAP